MKIGKIEMVDLQMAEILKTKTEAQRLQIAWGMWRSVRTMLTELLRRQHPEWSEEQHRAELQRRLSHRTE
jgi:hypothetical protein